CSAGRRISSTRSTIQLSEKSDGGCGRNRTSMAEAPRLQRVGPTTLPNASKLPIQEPGPGLRPQTGPKPALNRAQISYTSPVLRNGPWAISDTRLPSMAQGVFSPDAHVSHQWPEALSALDAHLSRTRPKTFFRSQ